MIDFKFVKESVVTLLGEENQQGNCREFQDQVSNLLLRHKSILDSITKFQESNARVNRAIVKAVTTCGCLKVAAEKQPLPEEGTIENYQSTLSTHLEGELCESCREVIINEIGNHFFYMSALANILNIDLNQAIEKESDKISTLGFFNLS